MPSPLSRTRYGAIALGVAGVLFLLYPAVRPWHDESTMDGAIASMSSDPWVAAHLFAMLGFILLPLGLLALRAVLAMTPGEPLAFAGFVVTAIGSGLTLPYYGAEDFGLHAAATAAAGGGDFDLLELVDATRFDPVAATMFASGLAALGVGAVLVAVAVWRSGALPRYAAIPFAAGFALFIPQFTAPAAVRIAHGALVAVGMLWLALVTWRATTQSTGR
jgi:hypothetical protein